MSGPWTRPCSAWSRAHRSTRRSASRFLFLLGLSVCFSGERRSRLGGRPITRDLAQALARKAGLQPVDGVTKSLGLLVVADGHTQSGKAKKAGAYGIRIVAEA